MSPRTRQEHRAVEETLDLGWDLLGELPRDQLNKIDRKIVDQYYPEDAEAEAGDEGEAEEEEVEAAA